MALQTNFKTPRDMAQSSIELFVLLVLLTLGLRFLFRLFGAEAGADGFVNWLYATSSVLLQPIRGVFPSGDVANRYAVEFVTLFAAVGYMVAGVVAGGVVDRWAAKRR
jgi:hypothetical protein